jgi:hypothetical protein
LNNRLVKSIETRIAEKIDISSLSSGLYLVKIELKNGEKINTKIVKESCY